MGEADPLDAKSIVPSLPLEWVYELLGWRTIQALAIREFYRGTARRTYETMGAYSAELMHHLPLPAADLAEAKKLFPDNIDFKNIQLEMTIDNYTFSEALDLNRAIF